MQLQNQEASEVQVYHLISLGGWNDVTLEFKKLVRNKCTF
jgi:hypothetical protein